VTQNQLNPAGQPRIEPRSMGEGEGISYVATFEVFPEVVLAPFDGIEIERTTATITDADIDTMIERLRSERPTYTSVDRAAVMTDRVTVDFEGAIDGVPFAGGKGDACSAPTRATARKFR
jgi:trigger factor